MFPQIRVEWLCRSKSFKFRLNTCPFCFHFTYSPSSGEVLLIGKDSDIVHCRMLG